MTIEEYKLITEKKELIDAFNKWIDNGFDVEIKEPRHAYPTIWIERNPIREEISSILQSAKEQIEKLLVDKKIELEADFESVYVRIVPKCYRTEP